MKENLHPQWYPQAKVICACGNSFTTGSTLPEIRTEICSQCHPFFTGKEKLIDTEGLVEKFERKRAAAKVVASVKKSQSDLKKTEEKKQQRPKTLKEMMEYASKQTDSS